MFDALRLAVESGNKWREHSVLRQERRFIYISFAFSAHVVYQGLKEHPVACYLLDIFKFYED